MTLKPSKKNTKKKQSKQKKQKNKKKEAPPKKQQKYQKIAFQLSVKFFHFSWWLFKISFLTPWPKKRAPKKHYKNRGFQALFFEKQMCVTKRPFLDQKKTKFINSSYHFFFACFLLFQQQKTRKLLKPLSL